MCSAKARLDQKWLRERFQDHFIDELTKELDETSYDMEGELINSQTLDFRALPKTAQYRLERLLIRALLAEVLPRQVAFMPAARFIAWSREAFEFYRLNIGNSDFVSIFSSDLSYNVILEPLLKFDVSSQTLKLKLEEYADVNLDGKIAVQLSSDLAEIVLEVASQSIQPALRRLAEELRAMERRPAVRTRLSIPILQEVELSTSYKDRRGLINFSTAGDRLSLLEGASKTISPNYKTLVDRAVSRLQSSRTLDRISNIDPILSGLFREYISVAKHVLDADNQLTLFAIGQEIDARIVYNQQYADDDEKLDGNALAYIVHS